MSGAALSERLLTRGDEVLGYDNVSAYYDPKLKEARLARLTPHERFSFVRAALEDRAAMERAFADFKPARVVNLAAQAGVRYSIENPYAYVESNLVGFINILEACRHGKVEHLVYASSSSVYGANRKLPFSVRDAVDHPVSLYAATKKANELMAHTYSHLYGLPTTGLRFFTVYGPWGRPDMATLAVHAQDPRRQAHRGVQSRPPQARLHLRRRYRRGRDPHARPRAGRRSRLRCAESEPGHIVGAVPRLQHRQPPAGRACIVI